MLQVFSLEITFSFCHYLNLQLHALATKFSITHQATIAELDIVTLSFDRSSYLAGPKRGNESFADLPVSD